MLHSNSACSVPNSVVALQNRHRNPNCWLPDSACHAPHSAAVPSKLTPPAALPPPKNSACCGKYDRTEQHDIAVCPRRQRSMRHEGKETARKTDQAQADTFFRHSPLLPSCVSFMPACLFYTILYMQFVPVSSSCTRKEDSISTFCQH